MILALLFAATTALAQYKVPALTGPVVDNANIIDRATTNALDSGIRQLKSETGTQLQVLTVDSLGGETIEQASIKTTDAWKLGGEKTDQGILLIVAPNERKVRIEVGQGLEGSLTDAYSNRIIQNIILPRFKSGDYSGGILQGVAAIVHYTNPEADVQRLFGGSYERRSSQHRDSGEGSWVGTLIFIIFILVLLFGRGGRGGGGRLSPWAAGAIGYGLGRGGGGGWGGGGGGWSGGGGGFSGGGASGSW